MKQLVIGCAVLLVLGMVGAGGASYLAYRKVSSTFAGFAELGSLPELEHSVRNHRPFTPPATGEPSQAQIAHLLEVQGRCAPGSAPWPTRSSTAIGASSRRTA